MGALLNHMRLHLFLPHVHHMRDDPLQGHGEVKGGADSDKTVPLFQIQCSVCCVFVSS